MKLLFNNTKSKKIILFSIINWINDGVNILNSCILYRENGESNIYIYISQIYNENN